MKFLKPTKGKVITFVIILIIFLLSNGFKIASFGRSLTSTEKLLNNIPLITSPGISNLLGDNGFFINYKPYGTFDMVLEWIFHVGLDLVYWYLLACVIIWIVGKIRKK